MSFIQKNHIKIEFGGAVDYDESGELILVQASDSVKIYDQNGNLVKELQQQLYNISSKQVNIRFAPLSQLQKQAIQVDESEIHVYQNLQNKLKIKTGNIIKKQSIIGFEWLSSQILVVFTKQMVYFYKILWPKQTDVAPIIDQQTKEQTNTQIKHYQVINNQYILLTLQLKQQQQQRYQILNLLDKTNIQVLSQDTQQLKSAKYVLGFLPKQHLTPLFQTFQQDLNEIIDNQVLTQSCQQNELELLIKSKVDTQNQLDDKNELIQSQNSIIHKNLAQRPDYHNNTQLLLNTININKNLLIFCLCDAKVTVFSIYTMSVIAEAHIPETYTNIFIAENLLFCINTKNKKFICFDIFNRDGYIQFGMKRSQTSLPKQQQTVNQLRAAIVNRFADDENSVFDEIQGQNKEVSALNQTKQQYQAGEQQSEPSVSFTSDSRKQIIQTKFQYPLIVELNSLSLQQNISVFRINAGEFLKQISGDKKIDFEMLVNIFHICSYRSDEFVGAFYNVFKQFLNQQQEDKQLTNITQLFILLLNYCFEVRICKQINQTSLMNTKIQHQSYLQEMHNSESASSLKSTQNSTAAYQKNHLVIKQTNQSVLCYYKTKTFTYERKFMILFDSLLQIINKQNQLYRSQYLIQMLTALSFYDLKPSEEQVILIISEMDINEVLMLLSCGVVEQSIQFANHLYNRVITENITDQLGMKLINQILSIYDKYNLTNAINDILESDYYKKLQARK